MLVIQVGRQNEICCGRFAEGRSTAAPWVVGFCTVLLGQSLDCLVLVSGSNGRLVFPGAWEVCVLC